MPIHLEEQVRKHFLNYDFLGRGVDGRAEPRKEGSPHRAVFYF